MNKLEQASNKRGLFAVIKGALVTSSALFSILSPVAYASEAGEQVQVLLADMSRALREQNYQGLLTYEHGGSMESLRLTHWVRDGVEYGSLDRLNGPAQQRLQKGLPTTCVPVADQLLRGLLKPFGAGAHNFEQNYHFYLRGNERIAGRQATVMQIVPRDQYRHGYNLAIDEQSALPLRAMIVSNDKRVLERFQFIDLRVGGSLEGLPEANKVRDQEAAATPCPQNVDVQESGVESADNTVKLLASHWQVGWMPSGFVLSDVKSAADLGEVLMFTDGLSAFSVFVSPPAKAEQKTFEYGRAQLGATVAYIHPVKVSNRPHVVTVVGEIPTQTAMRIASSVRPRQ
jgi:sigma-E factor negative regulatory protein RseB